MFPNLVSIFRLTLMIGKYMENVVKGVQHVPLRKQNNRVANKPPPRETKPGNNFSPVVRAVASYATSIQIVVSC